MDIDEMMADYPQVSVIIPTYNQAEYLVDTLKSVFAQKYIDFEIIVIDDGSTDETTNVIHQYENHIRYIYQDNQGLAGARNTGIREATGEYVALLDSDDLWLPNYLEEMMTLAAEQPKDAIYYCGVQYIDANGGVLLQKGDIGLIPSDEMYSKMLRTNPLVPSAIIMRRSVVVKEGLFDNSFRRLQDWELWIRLLRRGYSFAGLDRCLVRYRLHGRALSTDPYGGRKAAKALVEKHFGLDDGDWPNWPADKRQAYGGYYRYCAIYSSLVRQSDWKNCSVYLPKAFRVDPSLTVDLDLFYELALGTQPLGKRGANFNLDLEENEKNILSILSDTFKNTADLELMKMQPYAYGSAYYSLGLVAYNSKHLSLSRRYLYHAIRFRPDLWRNRQVYSILAKTFLGNTALNQLRNLRASLRGSTQSKEISPE